MIKEAELVAILRDYIKNLMLFGFWEPISMCGEGRSPHQQAILRHEEVVLRFSSILTSTWRQRQSPQVKGTVPQDCRFPVQKPSQVQIVTNAPDQLAVDHRFCDPLLRPD